MKKYRFWFNLAVGVAVAAFFLWLFFRRVEDWGEIAHALRTAKYIYLIPAIVFGLITYIFRAFRWYYLLYAIKRIRFFGLLSPILIGFMGNSILPARAGEFMRAYLLSEKEGVKLTASLATLVVDRMFDTFVLLLLIAGVLLFYPLDERVLMSETNYSLAQVRFFLGVIVTSIFAAMVAFTALLYFQKEYAARILERMVFFLPHRFRERVVSLFLTFTEGLHIFKNGRHVLLAVLITIVQWVFNALLLYSLFFAFDLQDGLSLWSSAAVLASAAVGVAIPTPGYAGPFHFFVQIGLQVCDSTISDAVAKVYALVAHAVTFFPIVIIGIALAVREGVSLSQIERTSETIKETVKEESVDSAESGNP
ncbi:MAG: lysylphosphatidylglycerol synthase transmembrane domain-containing protein [Candidatus Abyssubacteria bacterium]